MNENNTNTNEDGFWISIVKDENFQRATAGVAVAALVAAVRRVIFSKAA